MTRPLVWAFGLLASAAVTGLGVGDRLSALGLSPRPQAATATPAGAVASNPVVVVNADWRGHYSVHPSVEGRTIRMMVDTGATMVALSFEDAERAGIRVPPRDFRHPIGTANGVVMAAQVRIDELRLGDITVRGVEATVLPRGAMQGSLLGMSFLRRLKAFEVASGRLTLKG